MLLYYPWKGKDLQFSHWNFNNLLLLVEYKYQYLNIEASVEWLEMMLVTPDGAWLKNWHRKSLELKHRAFEFN